MTIYKLPMGSVLRTIRIDGCRLTGHDTRTWVFDITEGSTINIISPLEEFIKRKEVIGSPVRNIDALAEQVFYESINLLGGLRKLIEYRNLTWLPSLAEAAYAVVMKEELMKTHKEIAFDLGLTPQTVQNILRADAQEVERLKGIAIKGKTIEEIIEKMHFPVNNPAEVLKGIKDVTG